MKGKEGPLNLVATKGYSSTMAVSTLRKLLAASKLQRGQGLYQLPASRERERLFGATARGRLKAFGGVGREKALAHLGDEGWIPPEDDTCVAAFVRLLADRAAGMCPE